MKVLGSRRRARRTDPTIVPGVEIRIRALDGYELTGLLYAPSGESPERNLAVVFCGGGGIAAVKYRRFAAFLAAKGIAVLTFDYRGVGLSKPHSLRGFQATAEDWSECDVGGAIDWLASEYPASRLVGVTHSIGAFLIGGATNVSKLSRLIFIAAHTGFFGDYSPAYRLPMAFIWHGVMPALTRAFGYFPAHVLGLGNDIPAGVAMQWAARRTPDFRPDATDRYSKRGFVFLDRYQTVKAPVLSISFSDDAFATAQGARRLLAIYPSIDVLKLEISPADVGVPKIGHFGFFRSGIGESIWGLVAHHLLEPLVLPDVRRVAQAS